MRLRSRRTRSCQPARFTGQTWPFSVKSSNRSEASTHDSVQARRAWLVRISNTWRARPGPVGLGATIHAPWLRTTMAGKPGADAERQRRGYDYGRGAYYAKFLLDRRARGTYLRSWYRRTRRGVGIARLARLRRELAGAARYLVLQGLRPEAVPRFVEADSKLTFLARTKFT